MSDEIHIPILRLGEEYRSLDTVELEAVTDGRVFTHTCLLYTSPSPRD